MLQRGKGGLSNEYHAKNFDQELFNIKFKTFTLQDIENCVGETQKKKLFLSND